MVKANENTATSVMNTPHRSSPSTFGVPGSKFNDFAMPLRISVFALFLLLAAACTPLPEEVPLPTEICVMVKHHHQPIPNATVYIKYNADSFPGYDKPASYYDASFKTGAGAHGCRSAIPEGRHWLVAFGYDSLYFPHDVYGSIMVDISLDKHPKADTLLYVSE
jgi:hypothetical protein